MNMNGHICTTSRKVYVCSLISKPARNVPGDGSRRLRESDRGEYTRVEMPSMRTRNSAPILDAVQHSAEYGLSTCCIRQHAALISNRCIAAADCTLLPYSAERRECSTHANKHLHNLDWKSQVDWYVLAYAGLSLSPSPLVLM